MRYKKCLGCGTRNHPDAGVCRRCDESLDGLPVTDDTTEAQQPSARPATNPPPAAGAAGTAAGSPAPRGTASSLPLEHLPNRDTVFAVRSGAVLGRSADVDVTPIDRNCFISARHARFLCAGGQWRVELLSQANPSRYNDLPMRVGRQQPLEDGDQLTFADQTFIVRIE